MGSTIILSLGFVSLAVPDLQSGGAGWVTATPVTDYNETTSTVGVPSGFVRVTVTFTSTVGAGAKKFGRVLVSF